MNDVLIQPANLSHVKSIVSLIEFYSQKEIMLRRSEENVSREIRSFKVALNDRKVVGTIALFIYNQELSEIRSLTVHPDYQQKGVGRKLVEASESEAFRLKINNIFTLTMKLDFFEKMNFITIDKKTLPEKIWQDCSYCPRFADCQEISLIKKIR